MKLSIIIFTLILIYNSVLSFVLISPNSCSDSKNNTMYGTFMIAYISNLIITTLILFSIIANGHFWATLFAGVIEASYGWLFASSYTLYKDENTPDCLKRIAMATMVFASLFMLLIPVAVYSFGESIDINIIKFICGVETGKECDAKMADKIDQYKATKKDERKEAEKKKKTDLTTECETNIQASNIILANKKKKLDERQKLSDDTQILIKQTPPRSDIEQQKKFKEGYDEEILQLNNYVEDLKNLLSNIEKDDGCTNQNLRSLKKKIT